MIKERDAPRSLALKNLLKRPQRSRQTGKEEVCGHGNPDRALQEGGRGHSENPRVIQGLRSVCWT